jgi:hypothetical protein
MAGVAVGLAAGGRHFRRGRRRRIVGAKAGGALAELVNPTEYVTHFEKSYAPRRTTSGSEWSDYEPAYRYGYDSYRAISGAVSRTSKAIRSRFEPRSATAGSCGRREAVRDGWHHIERASPGDADRDGR